MESTAQALKPKAQQLTTKKRCELCHRKAATGKDVKGVGWVGPECNTRVAALQLAVERFGLKEALEDHVFFTYQLVSGGWQKPDHILRLIQKAEGLGLIWKTRFPNSNQPGEFWVEMPEGPKRRRTLMARVGRVAA